MELGVFGQFANFFEGQLFQFQKKNFFHLGLQSKVPDHKVGESQDKREPNLGEKEGGIRAGA